MALRLCRPFIHAGTLRTIRIANSKRAGGWSSNAGDAIPSSAGTSNLNVPGLQYRPSLSLARRRAAGCSGDSSAAATAVARARKRSSGALCRWLLWRLLLGRGAQRTGCCPARESAASFSQAVFPRLSHLIPYLQMSALYTEYER
jgi:hypothetical protein